MMKFWSILKQMHNNIIILHIFFKNIPFHFRDVFYNKYNNILINFGGEAMNLKEKVEKLKLNSININIDTEISEPLPIGASKFGGRPDLPEGFKWYYFKGQSPFTNEIKERPLSFLAQINCEEVKKYDLDNRLPHKGMLYFFYELESMVWGGDPKDKGASRVYYYDGKISDLIRTDFPDDMQKDFMMPELSLSFSSSYSVPYFEELAHDCNICSWDEYDELIEKSGYVSSENSSKLLGYSDNIQGDMLVDCEFASNGYYFGDASLYNSPIEKQLKKNRSQWKLLFQLDTVTADDFELMFGDCGRIYYFIKDEDLKNRNFNNTWLVLQCC